MNKRCKTCKYWERRTIRLGICRRMAEDMPIMIGEDGCDEHEKRENSDSTV